MNSNSGAFSVPSGYQLAHFTEIGSTNDEAKRAAETGEPGNLWVVADRQTAGRGRRGRGWVSGLGNLFASVMIRPAAAPEASGLLSLAASLAVHDALASLTGSGDALTCKWPNDVLLNGAKVAGILLESASSGGRIDWAVIGIGINVAYAPSGLPYPAASLRDAGFAGLSAADVFAALAQSVAVRIGDWEAGSGEGLRDAWLARAHGLGGKITAHVGTATVAGTFEGLDSDGTLIVREAAGGVRRIRSADVFPQSGS
ncbi:MAG: biotin--[acetyl-CoA-carboxylase] ligase [Sphingomonadales bacterium]|nr:biotin--[acetyl-CoA-carboxylase] ligase [Sphingomonadales bacterium]